MSKTLARLRSSAGVSKSNTKVARPARLRTSATYRLRGPCLLLPLPWANTTTPDGCSGIVRCPATDTGPALTQTSSSRSGGVGCTAGGSDPPDIAAGAIEQRHHLVIGGLREVAVSLPHRIEERGRMKADHLIGVGRELLGGVGSTDGNRQHHPAC